jgi:hypothetical protein
VFYIGDRYFGVISASVLGKQAENYTFTSALPVAILKLLAPALNGGHPIGVFIRNPMEWTPDVVTLFHVEVEVKVGLTHS